MTVKAYRTQAFQTTHENRAFDALLAELQRVWAESDDHVVLLGNFYCQGSEIDAAVLKQDSISVIDFKDYEGKVAFSENGKWYADDVEIRGGNKRNPYLQIRDNKFALLDFLKNLGQLPSGRDPNYGHISGIALFHRPIEFDDNQLPRTISPWFHIVDLDHSVERLSQITSRGINLSLSDIDAIVKALAIPAYSPPGVQPRIPAPTVDGGETTSDQVIDCLKPAVAQIEKFIESAERILLVSGMMGTGANNLLETIVHHATSTGRNCLVLAPNRRMADRYPVDAESLYSHIYTTHLRVEKEQLVYDAAENSDPETQIYVIGDCHLVSDSKFETDVLRYGSGQLLTDLVSFVDLPGSRRKIIFIGDPFQMGRGKTEETAMSAERIQALADTTISKIGLDTLLPEMVDDPFVDNCVELAGVMRRGVFNHLHLKLDDMSCIEAPHDPEKRVELVNGLITDMPRDCKFVAFSHAEVNRLNNWIRKNVFNREGPLAVGDIVHIHNGFIVTAGDAIERPVLVPNDSFAEIVSIDQGADPIVQPLRGRKDPITVAFIRVQARIPAQSDIVEFLCLRDYLYAEKPELDIDTLLALRVSAESRYRQRHRDQTGERRYPGDEEDLRDIGGDIPDRDEKRAQFLLADPYLNAARMRFGYAVTLHRAQGRKFDTVIANLDTGQGQANDAYMRWLYTLFTVPRRAIYLSNIPNINPFSRAEWEGGRSRLDTVRPTNLIAYDSSEVVDPGEEMPFPIEGKELQSLFRFIDIVTKKNRWQVTSIEHHSYQEVYGIRGEQGRSCELRLFYNKHFQVSRIETVKSDPGDFAEEVIAELTSGVRFDNDFQRELYETVTAQFDAHGLRVAAIDHSSYQEVYYIKSDVGDVKLQIHYDGDGFVSSVVPVAHSQPAASELVRTSLGL